MSVVRYGVMVGIDRYERHFFVYGHAYVDNLPSQPTEQTRQQQKQETYFGVAKWRLEATLTVLPKFLVVGELPVVKALARAETETASVKMTNTRFIMVCVVLFVLLCYYYASKLPSAK